MTQDCPACFNSGNSFAEPALEILRRHPKRIVFPEGEDIRVIRVAARLVAEGGIVPILLGNKEKIRRMADEDGISTRYIRIIEPKNSSDLALFSARYERIERFRGNPAIANSAEVMERPHYFASMMVQYGQADAMVAGNQVGIVAVYRAAARMIKPLAESKKVFGITVAHIPSFEKYGNKGIFYLADTGLVNEPSVEELADMALVTGQFARHLKGSAVRVAMLSSSTRGSNPHSMAKKMGAATVLAKRQAADKFLTEDIFIEGETQIDAAIDPAAYCMRGGQEGAASSADVLIFPDLDTGDIVSRMLSLFPDVKLYGLFLAGLALPVVQVPRLTTEDRIFGSSLIAGLEAIKSHQLHPGGNAEVF